MSLPYRWRPEGADNLRRTTTLKPGELIAFEHAVWRVIEVHPKPVDETYPWRVRLRPAHINTGDVRDRDHDVPMKATAEHWWSVYPDEHYPICANCHEPLPCREQMAAEIAEQEAERFDRYSIPGVCPACEEPVSQRQKSISWEDNAVVPGGPLVTFHLRRRCFMSAVHYEKRWVALDPNRRKAKLSCGGHMDVHADGTTDCTELADCPGPRAQHKSWSRHHAQSRFSSGCWCVAGDLSV